MESAIENHFRNNFFNPISDVKTFRKNQLLKLVELRKDKRYCLLSKRRHLSDTDFTQEKSPPAQSLSGLSISDLISILNYAPNPEKAASAHEIRKRSLKSPLINELVENGILKCIKPLLLDSSCPELQSELIWTLTNISSADCHCAEIIENGYLDTLEKLLNSAPINIKEQSIWVLGNLIADDFQYRDLILNSDIFYLIIDFVKSVNESSMIEVGIWTLSNLCRMKPLRALPRLKNAFLVFVEILQMSKTFEILSDCLWGMSSITEVCEDVFEELKSSDCCRIIVKLAESRLYDIQLPAIKIIGNLAYGPMEQMNLIIAAGAIDMLQLEIRSQRMNIQREVIFAFSNICASTPKVLDILISKGVFEKLIQLALSPNTQIQDEVVWALSNSASISLPKQLSHLIKLKLLEAMCSLLKSNSTKTQYISLLGLEQALKRGKEYFTKCRINEFISIIEECEGDKLIVNIANSHEGNLSEKAEEILKSYFDAEDDSESSSEPCPTVAYEIQ